MFTFAPETPADAGEIEKLLDVAFGAGRLAKASYQFRHGVKPVEHLKLVARDGDKLVGAIRYWPVRIGDANTPALLLGPLAVDPTRRGEGIGRILIARTLDRATMDGVKIVLLVGDLPYYRQFGFKPAAPHGILMPREKPERLLVRALAPDTLDGVSGEVRSPRRARVAKAA
ncbi:MAG: GNAT family N-acetyltransferase [Dongiaceae bacterium]